LGPVTIKFILEVNEPIRRGDYGVCLHNIEGKILWGWLARNVTLEPGIYEFQHVFPILPLCPGVYTWFLGLYDYDEGRHCDLWTGTPNMIVAVPNYQHPDERWIGPLNIQNTFSIARYERI
jgi:hypothetical protein